MNEITIVDARMGRGKSSAAIRYMNEHKRDKRFLYITPYLDEVARICEQCDFDQPDSDTRTKSAELKKYLHQGKNVSATHSLFYLMDKDALDLVREMHYSLIVDESVQVIERLNVTSKDTKIVTNTLAEEDENGGGTQTWDDQAQPPQKAAQNKTWKGWGDLCGHAVFEDLKQQICQRQRKDKGRPIFVGAVLLRRLKQTWHRAADQSEEKHQ